MSRIVTRLSLVFERYFYIADNKTQYDTLCCLTVSPPETTSRANLRKTPFDFNEGVRGVAEDPQKKGSPNLNFENTQLAPGVTDKSPADLTRRPGRALLQTILFIPYQSPIFNSDLKINYGRKYDAENGILNYKI